jgi:hypothetical protein
MNRQKLSALLKTHFFDGLAITILSIFFVTSFSLIHSESVTSDEQAHIPAAYGYVMQGDFTLNPEHPPLAKLIAGIGFIGSHYNFPTRLMHERTNLSDLQWRVGNVFLYHSGNSPDSILFRSRLPILVASIIGLFICYVLFAGMSSKKVAFLTLFFTALSPTVIAHGHLVTTDVLVMLTSTIAILCFIRFLQRSSVMTGTIAGISLAVAELSKFSAVLLLLFYIIAAILFYYARNPKPTWQQTIKLTIRTIVPVYLLTAIIIYAVYLLQVIHVSPAIQDAWIVDATTTSPHQATQTLLKINSYSPASPLIRYFFGFSSSFLRVTASHNANLLGRNYSTGTVLYFPIVGLLKAPSPLIAIWILMVGFTLKSLKLVHFSGQNIGRVFLRAIRDYPVPTLGAMFAILYFTVACLGTLDIGVRHILPLFTWVAFLSSLWIVSILQKVHYETMPIGKVLVAGFVGLYALVPIFIFPNYIPYTTEIAGGAPAAYRYYNDSNVEWGQPFKYLAIYIKQHPAMAPLYTDWNYFEAKNYYVCGFVDHCSRWHFINDNQRPSNGSYFVVSEMQLTSDWAYPGGPLAYLKHKKPVAKVGDSIYIYHM